MTNLNDFVNLDIDMDRDSLLTNEVRIPRLNPKFTLDATQKITENVTPYLKAKMGVCLEMEVDRTYSQTGNYYDDLEPYNHLKPHGLIRAYHSDCTINGPEIIINADPMPGEDFAKYFPIDIFRKYFHISTSDSTHSHVMVPDQKDSHKVIPTQIALNAFSLFKANYPAWVWLFGNYKDVLLRSSWGTSTCYTRSIADPAFWTYGLSKHNLGVHFAKTTFSYRDFNANTGLQRVGDIITWLDAEIRTSDGTLWVDQLVGIRALSKALFLRAADVAKLGVVNLTDKLNSEIVKFGSDVWNVHHGSVPYINLEQTYGPMLKRYAKDFYYEMKPYMTPFERRAVKGLILNPVRDRAALT